MSRKPKSITEHEDTTDLEAVNAELDEFTDKAEPVLLVKSNANPCADCGAPEYAHGKYTDHLGVDTQTHAYRVGVWDNPNGGHDRPLHTHGTSLAATFRGLTGECPYCIHQKLAEREATDLNHKTDDAVTSEGDNDDDE